MTGYDVIRSVRATANGRSAFAVALTGYAQHEDVDRARESGFDAHAPKPLSTGRLEALLAEAVRRRSARRFVDRAARFGSVCGCAQRSMRTT